MGGLEEFIKPNAKGLKNYQHTNKIIADSTNYDMDSLKELNYHPPYQFPIYIVNTSDVTKKVMGLITKPLKMASDVYHAYIKRKQKLTRGYVSLGNSKLNYQKR